MLVQRSARGVRLTEAGEARRAPRRGDPRAASPRPRPSSRRSPACAAAGCGWRRSSRPPSSLMPLAIAALPRSAIPAVELSMTLLEPEDALPLLRAGELDLAHRLRVARRRRGDGRHRAAAPARGPDVPRAAARPPARAQAQPAPRPTSPTTPWIAGTADCECNRLIMPRLRGRRVRPADRLRDRRLQRRCRASSRRASASR